MKVIEPSTPNELKRYYELRWRILRAPWNQPRGSEQDNQEHGSNHFMVVDSRQTAMGVGRLQFNTIGEAQIRYMAIDTEQQRRGIGTLLLNTLEDKAIELGATRIVLDAREHALGFYRKYGYQLEGPGHVLFNTIPHVRMRKTIE